MTYSKGALTWHSDTDDLHKRNGLFYNQVFNRIKCKMIKRKQLLNVNECTNLFVLSTHIIQSDYKLLNILGLLTPEALVAVVLLGLMALVLITSIYIYLYRRG